MRRVPSKSKYQLRASGRQDSIHHKDGSTVKQGFDYDFDNGSNITKITHEDGSYWHYDYDGRDRLIEAVRGNKATPTIEATYEYTYDDGDNMLTKTVPWYDDFQDGNITGWSGDTGYYSVSGGVLKNTLDASVTRGLRLSESDADHDLRFGYVRYSASGTARHHLRYTNGNNRLWVDIEPTRLRVQQVDNGSVSTLATYNTTVSTNIWYDLRAVLDGGSLKIWWGERGGAFNEVISTTTTETTTIYAAFFQALPNTEHGWDDLRLIAGTRSTVETFTYNDANEQLTHGKNGVTTTMTYDDWGRLEERDDGTHTATYGYRYGSKLYSVASDFPGEGNVTYEYGGDGKRRSRVAGVEETWYNYTAGFDVVSMEDDADGSSGALSMSSIVLRPQMQVSFSIADIAGSTPSSGTARYYAYDHLGSTRSVWNASKVQVGNYGFDPYGGEFAHAGAALNSIAGAYTGKPWDGTAKLFHFPYRQFCPDLARWTTRDPFGMVDGPNIYAYVSSRPLVGIDLLGAGIIMDIICAIFPCGPVPMPDPNVGKAICKLGCAKKQKEAEALGMDVLECTPQGSEKCTKLAEEWQKAKDDADEYCAKVNSPEMDYDFEK